MPDQITESSGPQSPEIAEIVRQMFAHCSACRTCGQGNAAACPAGLALAHALASATYAADVARAAE
ncbi:MAG: hypothetical protein ACYDD0_08515 [Candidatus Dormibacteria bacterium]